MQEDKTKRGWMRMRKGQSISVAMQCLFAPGYLFSIMASNKAFLYLGFGNAEFQFNISWKVLEMGFHSSEKLAE